VPRGLSRLHRPRSRRCGVAPGRTTVARVNR
jgi:hypothetical protein